MNKRKDVVAKPKTSKLSISLPAKVTVANSGNYIMQKIKEEINISLPASTASAITLVAKEAAKKKMRLDEFSLEIGNTTWLPLKSSFKWKK